MAAAASWRTQSEANVSGCIRLALGELDGEPALQDFLLGFLRKRGRLLGPTEPLWPKFVLETCSSLGGSPTGAAWAAAAVEFSVTAIDVADDLADGDLATDHEATIRAPSAALALAWLAQYCCARVADEIGYQRAHRVSFLMATGSLASCAGQDMDMLLESHPDANMDQAAATSWRKSGALAAMASSIGAACAIDSMAIIEIAGRFGSHAGMVAQLVNDIDGVAKGEHDHSADIHRRKKTLPVVFALECARDEGIAHLLDWYQSDKTGKKQHARVARTIRELGSLHYTWAVANIHQNQAIETLAELESLSGRPSVWILRQLLPSLLAE